MVRRWGIRSFLAMCVMLSLFLLLPMWAWAEGQADGEQRFYLGSVEKTGLDTGYTEENAIEESDPHFGWSIGSFAVTGFTGVQRGGEKGPTFLKTSGDTLTLWFHLNQDIDCLNGDQRLTVADDVNGFDQRMGIDKSEPGFGRGTLIVRHTDWQNSVHNPQIYNDYLSGIEVGADTEVQLCEEGDYEVVLDYEIKDDSRALGPVVLPEYSNYSIRFTFSVRNGNTMVFLFDAESGSELTNSASTENGFRIDLAQSRYLEVTVKREILSDDGDKLVEDTRFNKPAKDGETFTDEGVYTITVGNPSTGQSTEKMIYVGSDPVLKTYAETGYSLEEIRSMITLNSSADDGDGRTWSEDETDSGEGVAASGGAKPQGWPVSLAILVSAALVVVCGMVLVVRKRVQGNGVVRGLPQEERLRLPEPSQPDFAKNTPVIDEDESDE